MHRQGGVVEPILGTILLPIAEDGRPPLPLPSVIRWRHLAAGGCVLSFREKTEADVVLSTQFGHEGGHVRRQVVPY